MKIKTIHQSSIARSGNFLLIAFSALIFELVFCEEINCQKGIISIGIVTDTHYDRILFPDRIGKTENIVKTFNDENVDLVLGLGDIYEGNYSSFEDYLIDRAPAEAAWSRSKAPVHWAMGNHDNWGITSDQYTSNNNFIHSRNYTIDLRKNWRIVIYANCDGQYFSSGTNDLKWLRSALKDARTGKKKIIIATHVRIDQDYPGNPPSFTSGKYSAFSYNAKQQRDIIDSAKMLGTDIKYIFHGHIHNNSKTTVNGIDYYCFKNTGSDGSFAIVNIQKNGSLIIKGSGSQKSYE